MTKFISRLTDVSIFLFTFIILTWCILRPSHFVVQTELDIDSLLGAGPSAPAAKPMQRPPFGQVRNSYPQTPLYFLSLSPTVVLLLTPYSPAWPRVRLSVPRYRPLTAPITRSPTTTPPIKISVRIIPITTAKRITPNIWSVGKVSLPKLLRLLRPTLKV